jgi:tetrahydromethanopterin S-methyltransferase subunit F
MTDRDKQAALAPLSSLEEERSVSNTVDDILYRAELVGRRMRNETKQ